MLKRAVSMFLKNLRDSVLTKENIGSSVRIVSDYRLDDRATAVLSPAEAKNFSSSLCAQTSSEAHPASV
jgi:hypothetical protein